MMRYVIIILIALTACSPCRQIVEQTDSVSHVAHERDSVSHTTSERDSIYLRDSIYIYQRGDTIYHYKERQVVKWCERVDTLTKYIARADTTSKIANRREESTPISIASDPVKWYDRGFIWLGRLCLIALIMWSVFLYLKRKL